MRHIPTLLLLAAVLHASGSKRMLHTTSRRLVVQMERELWILMQAVSPREAAIWIADKRDAITDPEFCAIYLEYDLAFDWSADDPRLDALADRSAQWFVNRYANTKGNGKPVQDPTLPRLIAMSFGGTSPAWDRLAQIANQRKPGG